MAPYYGPTNEDSDTIMLERMFLAGDYVAGVGYGIQIVMYLTCATYLWKSRWQRRRSTFLLLYISFLMCVETMFEIAQAHTVQLMYIDDRNYPGGPWSYFLATQQLPTNVIFIASLVTLAFLSDFLVLWRCWIIWSAFGDSAARLAITLPSILLLASFVLGVFWAVDSSKQGTSLYSSLPIVLGTSYYATSLGVNIVLTILISTRLLYYRRAIFTHLPKAVSKSYVSLMTIVIESASIYSIPAAIFLVTYGTNRPVNSVFLGTASASQQIANYLIIFRIAHGHDWNKTEVTAHSLTTISQADAAGSRTVQA